MQHSSFCFLFLSLNITFLKFIHIVGMYHYFLGLNKISLDHNQLFVYPLFVCRHMGYFHILAVVNDHYSTKMSSFLGYIYTRSRIVGLSGNSILRIWGNTKLFSILIPSFNIPTNNVQEFPFP